MLGVSQVFIRLAGCPVNCPGCDTNYTVADRVECREIVRRVVDVAGGSRWVWITGGEPVIHDTAELVDSLRKYGFRVAMATSGIRAVDCGFGFGKSGGVDFLSVSPHVISGWVQRSGDQLNVVPGLNGLRIQDVAAEDLRKFSHKWVTPLYGSSESVRECLDWVRDNPEWRMGIQAHKTWGVS